MGMDFNEQIAQLMQCKPLSVQEAFFCIIGEKIKEKARVVAIEQRGHGKSSTANDLDLSIDLDSQLTTPL